MREARAEGILFRAAILDMQMPGMDDAIAKPTSVKALANVLAKWLPKALTEET